MNETLADKVSRVISLDKEAKDIVDALFEDVLVINKLLVDNGVTSPIWAWSKPGVNYSIGYDWNDKGVWGIYCVLKGCTDIIPIKDAPLIAKMMACELINELMDALIKDLSNKVETFKTQLDDLTIKNSSIIGKVDEELLNDK